MTKEEIEKEWQRELQIFLKKVDNLPRDNSETESEWKFSKKTRKQLEEELKKIQKKYRKKYEELQKRGI